MLDIFYTIIISPIIQIIEFVFVFFYKITHSFTIPLFGVSLAVSLLSLPLYMMAEKWQKIERETVNRLKPKVKKIKSVFSGDEQFMILSAYYRQNHYHPIYALRNSFGLLIQIPFFVAAYSYLSNLELLNGVGFSLIKDLGKPDSLLVTGTMQINVLPVLMTLINCISGFVYTKGLPVRDKFQVYAIACFFLVFLYNSPSGLVIYWTLNNLFSLVKNIFYKLKRPRKVIYILGVIFVTCFIIHLLFFMQTRSIRKRLLIVFILSVFYFLPFILRGLRFIQTKILSTPHSNKMRILMLFSCFALFLLAGLYIPSSIISSSPEEFTFIGGNDSPFTYLGYSGLFFFGLFFFWPFCIYLIFHNKIKSYLTVFFVIVSLSSIIYTLLFSGDYGTLTSTFQFATSGVLNTQLVTKVLSILVPLFIMLIVFFLIMRNKIQYLLSIFTILIVFLTIFTITSSVKIYRSFNNLRARQDGKIEEINLLPVFSLSKESNNLIIIMADAAVSGFVPLIFNDHQKLYSQFDGFTLYNNTASYSYHTLMGVPPIWGGYDYTPSEINSRSNIPLVEKHNEALLIMPLLLSKAGFSVTVTDPSWANYAWIPDTSIYNNHNSITAFNMTGRYNNLWHSKNGSGNSEFILNTIKRNIIWFSFLKINMPLLRLIIYDNGWYWNTENLGASLVEFINSYAPLDFLNELTEFSSEKPSALFITNELTHTAAFLQPDNLMPTLTTTKMGTSQYSENGTYHSNAALYLSLGDWFENLKANSVYDNTRIIIVSDHGAGFSGLISQDPLTIPEETKEKYNPVLLYKDFNSHGQLRIEDTFMTNADTPALAIRNIIENPVNPFTGNAITTEPKNNGILITTCHIPMADGHGKYEFSIGKDQWIYLRDSIFESSNWSQVER